MHCDEQNFSWKYPDPFVEKVKVTPNHTDRLGHTNNTRYLEWLEDIAWQHITFLGCGWNVMESLGKAFAIIKTELNYLFSSYEGDELAIGTWVVATDGRMRSSRFFEIIRCSDQKKILTAQMDFVSISLKDGRPVKMEQEMKTALIKGLVSGSITS